MHMGYFDEAERLLHDALSKSANDANSLMNLLVCLQLVEIGATPE